MFNRKRLTLARERRGYTGVLLSEKSGITAITISRIESGQTKRPDERTIAKLAQVLEYPVDFFYKNQVVEELDTETVSFRSLKKMNAKQRSAALWAGTIGLELYDWVEQFYELPNPNVPDLGGLDDPESAARILRQEWGLGDRPIGHVLKLLESRGVRVLSLEESHQNVDAYSFWRGERPFMFLNSFKTPEHSVFDCAHELGHLVLHKHAGPRPARSAELEANRFASAFLMPADDVKAAFSNRAFGATGILKAKFRWKVSALALTVRLHQLDMISDWQYRSLCIELGKLGYRSSEPQGVEREKSTVWQMILGDLWSKRLTKEDIAKQLNLPRDEIERLVFSLTGNAVDAVPASATLVAVK